MKGIASLILIIVALIVICAAGATIYYVYATANPSPALPDLSGSSNSTVQALKSSQVYQLLSASPNIDSSVLSQPQPNAPAQYNISYSGKISMVASIHGAPVPIGVPIMITNLKYANDSKLAISLTSIPIIGSINASIAKFNGTIYACAPQNLASKNATYSCFAQPTANANTLTLFYLVQRLNLTVSRVYPSAYAGTPCAAINSTFVIPVGKVQPFLGQLSFLSGIVNATAINGIDGSLQACISSAGLPITSDMSLRLYSQTAITTIDLTLAESASSDRASDAAIRQLPGPVQG